MVHVNGDPKMVISSEGWVLTLPRHTKSYGNSYNSQTIMEHSSAGLDKLSADSHALVGLQGKLLDHAASAIEQTMRSAAGVLEYDEVLHVLKRLIEIFPLRAAMTTVQSNYNVL